MLRKIWLITMIQTAYTCKLKIKYADLSKVEVMHMLMDADVGEGGIKNQPKSADVVYGWSQTHFIEVSFSF